MNQDENNKEGIDSSSALKHSRVEFQDELQRPAQTFYPRNLKVVRWVMKYSGGLIKDEKQAGYVLIGFVALAIIVSLFLLFSGGGLSKPPVGYRGNVPDLPEYRNPPTPRDFR